MPRPDGLPDEVNAMDAAAPGICLELPGAICRQIAQGQASKQRTGRPGRPITVRRPQAVEIPDLRSAPTTVHQCEASKMAKGSDDHEDQRLAPHACQHHVVLSRFGSGALWSAGQPLAQADRGSRADDLEPESWAAAGYTPPYS